LSYLQWNNATIPNMSRAIISLWFRGAVSSAGAPETAPPLEAWPFPPPPDPSKPLQQLNDAGAPNGGFIFWSPWGIAPNNVLPIPGPSPLIFTSPPVVADPYDPTKSTAILPHDRFNFLLTFGDPAIQCNYRPWICQKISDTPGVIMIPTPWRYADWPPPYPAYLKAIHGKEVGNDGLIDAYNISLGDPQPRSDVIPQSFIGVQQDGTLKIVLQTDTYADCKGYLYVTDKAQSLYARYTEFTTHWSYTAPYWSGYQLTYRDQSKELLGMWPEFFVLCGPQVDDNWNHLLLSFDIAGSVSLIQNESGGVLGIPICSTSCQAWLALNDKNVDNYDLNHGLQNPYANFSGFWDRNDLSLGPNDIVPQNVYIQGTPRAGLPHVFEAFGGSILGPHYDDGLDPLHYISFLGLGGGPGLVDPTTAPDPKTTLAVPNYNAGPFSIPTSGYPIGVPTSDRHVDHNCGCEMAELQIWVGKTLDVSVESNRRLFIDDKGNPVNTSVAEKALGRPDVRLHRSSNWKSGLNSGSTGFDPGPPPAKTPSGQFGPVGGIESYKPDPQVGK
jgi:hypothetical protein